MTTRRTVLALAAGALAAVPTLALARPAPAPAAPFAVTFSPVVTEAWGQNLALVRATLQSTLASLLGPRFAGNGQRLVVAVDSLSLSANGGNGGRVREGGSGADILESVVTLYDASGRVLGSWPIRSTEFGGGMPQSLPNLDQLRLEALARNNAWWIKHYLGA